MNPYDLLTDEDKELLKSYIFTCASAIPDLEKVLFQWNKNKRTLCKALGGQLRLSVPIDLEMEETIFNNKLAEIYQNVGFSEAGLYGKQAKQNHPFYVSLGRKIADIISPVEHSNIRYLFSYNHVRRGTCDLDLKFKSPDGTKELKIPRGTKIMRAIRKVITFYGYDQMELFEDWRDAISLLGSTKKVRANLVFSIHPIDFMTMSDNNCDWTSCMSWMQKGGYSAGVIEMLNSNIAMVCYIESAKEFKFNECTIPNKSWRCLAFAHKDIIVAGKSYPYASDMLYQQVVISLREIVKKNLEWSYQYGPQRYGDLLFIRDKHLLLIESEKIRAREGHHIYLSMYGMYHDMVEDKEEIYWCCRNYVPKNKIISASGLGTCMCCGEYLDNRDDAIINSDCTVRHRSNHEFIHSVKTRFETAFERKLCDDCYADRYCHNCHISSLEPHYLIPVFSKDRTHSLVVCESCLFTEYVYLPAYKAFALRDERFSLPSDTEIIPSREVENIERLIITTTKAGKVCYPSCRTALSA